jgi:DNA polymerase-1
MEAVPRLFVIDVMPLLYRGHFVFLRNPRITSTGINTSALQGFASILFQLLDEYQPSHVALVLDSTTPTFRRQEYPEYKAQREKAPEDLVAAIPMAMELASALRIQALRVDGFEADDLMGTLAARGAAAGIETWLVTPDKDVAQLVAPGVVLCRPGKGSSPPEILHEADVCKTWGLASPAQMVDYLGMAGDASDNIPGIDGVGEKTAIALLQQYGSLDRVLAHASELKGKLAERVAACREQAILSRRLATIRRDVPLAVALDELQRREPDRETLRTLLARFEFVQLGRRLLGETIAAAAAPGKTYHTIRETPHTYTCVRTEAQLASLLQELTAVGEWSFDTETTGLDARHDRLVGMSFATAPGRAWYVPVPAEEAERARLLARLAPLFAGKARKVAHNLKFDFTVLRHHGLVPASPLHDSMLAHYVYDASDRHGIDHLARTFLDYDKITTEQLIGKKGEDQKSMADLPPEAVSDYAAEDADVALQLYRKLQPEVAAAGGQRALEACEEPLVEVLADMEEEGIRIDPVVLRRYSLDLERELASLERQIGKYADVSGSAAAPADGELALDADAARTTFNLASPKQMGELLFDRLQLDPDAKRTASGQYATDEETLQKLVGRHPIIGLILDHRACSKLKNTYVDKLPDCIEPQSGRVHTTFSQALTETGRLSSSNPNLQNIPIRTERGRPIRAAFVARDADHVLVSADYSQIELRVMAALSGDPGMRAAFARGADIHTETAVRVYGVMPALVTPEMRSRCKMVNFGIIYGISAFGLAGRLGIPRSQAAGLIEEYFRQYPGVKGYMDRTIAFAREHGYVRTELGRRRFLRDINSRNATARQAAERNAINTPVQGTAADLIKLAMVRIHRELGSRKLRSRMVLQVHDELLFDVPRHEEPAVRELVQQCMTGAMELGVPLEVEIGSGASWLEAH